MKTITKPEDLEIGQYYHCTEKRTKIHSIHKTGSRGAHIYFGDCKVWAHKGNMQAFDRWDIVGPIEKP